MLHEVSRWKGMSWQEFPTILVASVVYCLVNLLSMHSSVFHALAIPADVRCAMCDVRCRDERNQERQAVRTTSQFSSLCQATSNIYIYI